jgi:hypothetical protein
MYDQSIAVVSTTNTWPVVDATPDCRLFWPVLSALAAFSRRYWNVKDNIFNYFMTESFIYCSILTSPSFFCFIPHAYRSEP